MEIKELKDGMKKVNIEAKVVERGELREVKSKYKDETYSVRDAVIADLTGTIKLVLWNEQVDLVDVNDNIKVENGYITSFKDELQLNIGKYGKITVDVN